MICYRFENADQLFSLPEGSRLSLPLTVLKCNPGLIEKYKGSISAEIPALVYPEKEDELIAALKKLKSLGMESAVCENIGAVYMCRESGLRPFGGMFLNVLNSEACSEYAALGIESITLSPELQFAQVRKIKSPVPVGVTVYGYLPLMKFRACPVKAQLGCRECGGLSELTDRMGEKFPVICREKEYSELLNCVPLYVGDKSVPPLDFYTLYFTKESGREAEKISNMYISRKAPEFKRTNGLYYRELL